MDLLGLKDMYNNGTFKIGEHEYTLAKMTHKKRVAVYAYFTKIAKLIDAGDHSFLVTEEFGKIENIMGEHILFEGMQISKLPDHWEVNQQEFVVYIIQALSLISFPFFRAGIGA